MKAIKLQSVGMSELIGVYGPGDGRHWFDADSKRFFRCKLPRNGYSGPGGLVFVSSEQGPGMARRYSVRRVTVGRVETVGEFQQYATAGTARTVARKVAAGVAV